MANSKDKYVRGLLPMFTRAVKERAISLSQDSHRYSFPIKDSLPRPQGKFWLSALVPSDASSTALLHSSRYLYGMVPA
jgi:hypothetical protein